MTLTIHTLAVAVAVTLWGTASLAVSAELSSLPVSSAEQSDRPSATAAIPTVPLFALSRLDAQTLAGQEMTEQELKAVEGGLFGWLFSNESYLVFKFDSMYISNVNW